jgi:hypothetical protein
MPLLRVPEAPPTQSSPSAPHPFSVSSSSSSSPLRLSVCYDGTLQIQLVNWSQIPKFGGHFRQNAFAESFIGRLRDECLNETLFSSLAHARMRLKLEALTESKNDYNNVRPHSALGNLPPKKRETSVEIWSEIESGAVSGDSRLLLGHPLAPPTRLSKLLQPPRRQRHCLDGHASDKGLDPFFFELDDTTDRADISAKLCAPITGTVTGFGGNRMNGRSNTQ